MVVFWNAVALHISRSQQLAVVFDLKGPFQYKPFCDSLLDLQNYCQNHCKYDFPIVTQHNLFLNTSESCFIGSLSKL